MESDRETSGPKWLGVQVFGAPGLREDIFEYFTAADLSCFSGSSMGHSAQVAQYTASRRYLQELARRGERHIRGTFSDLHMELAHDAATLAGVARAVSCRLAGVPRDRALSEWTGDNALDFLATLTALDPYWPCARPAFYCSMVLRVRRDLGPEAGAVLGALMSGNASEYLLEYAEANLTATWPLGVSLARATDAIIGSSEVFVGRTDAEALVVSAGVPGSLLASALGVAGAGPAARVKNRARCWSRLQRVQRGVDQNLDNATCAWQVYWMVILHSALEVQESRLMMRYTQLENLSARHLQRFMRVMHYLPRSSSVSDVCGEEGARWKVYSGMRRAEPHYTLVNLLYHINAAEPDAAEPDTAEPGAAEPDTAEPDAAEPDTAE